MVMRVVFSRTRRDRYVTINCYFFMPFRYLFIVFRTKAMAMRVVVARFRLNVSVI